MGVRRTIAEARSAEQGEGYGEGDVPPPHLKFFEFPHCNGCILGYHVNKLLYYFKTERKQMLLVAKMLLESCLSLTADSSRKPDIY